MELVCKICGREVEVDGRLSDGQFVKCPFCSGRFMYGEETVQAKAPPTIHTVCPGCGSVFEVDAKYEDTFQPCPECGRNFCIWSYNRDKAGGTPPPAPNQAPVRITVPECRDILGLGGGASRPPTPTSLWEAVEAAPPSPPPAPPTPERPKKTLTVRRAKARPASGGGRRVKLPQEDEEAGDGKGFVRTALGGLVVVLLVAAAVWAYKANKVYQERVAQEAREAEVREMQEVMAYNERVQRENERLAREREERALARDEAAQRSREERETARQVRERRAAEAQAAQAREAETERLKRAFEQAKGRFAASLGFVADAPAWDTPQGATVERTFWCAFPSYATDGLPSFRETTGRARPLVRAAWKHWASGLQPARPSKPRAAQRTKVRSPSAARSVSEPQPHGRARPCFRALPNASSKRPYLGRLGAIAPTGAPERG